MLVLAMNGRGELRICPYRLSTIYCDIAYNKKLFSLEDQFKLKNCIDVLSGLGAFYILTNAHHEVIDGLFSPGSIKLAVSRSSTLGGRNARRGNTQEYIFTNIPQARIGDIDGLA